MTQHAGSPMEPYFPALPELRRNWKWLLALGIGLMILGILALSWSVLTTLASVVFFGWLLFFAGIIQGVHAFWARRWSGFFLHLLVGILNVVVGLLIVANPGAGAISLTLLLAALFMVGGLFRMFGAAIMQFRHWGWVFFNGLIALILGILIWAQWPMSGFWVIGMFIGIELLFSGWSLVLLSMEAHTLPPEPAM